jgi:hypothetical protein
MIYTIYTTGWEDDDELYGNGRRKLCVEWATLFTLRVWEDDDKLYGNGRRK